MKAKPINIQGNGTWESKYGLMYQFDIEMEDGNSGQYSSSKHQDKDAEDFPFKVGVELEYEFTPHEKFPKIKLPKKDFNGFSGGYNNKDYIQLMIVRQSSLKSATEVLMHNMDKVKADDIIKLAEHFTKWVMKAEVKTEVKAVERPVVQQPVSPIPKAMLEEAIDSLPF